MAVCQQFGLLHHLNGDRAAINSYPRSTPKLGLPPAWCRNRTLDPIPCRTGCSQAERIRSRSLRGFCVG